MHWTRIVIALSLLVPGVDRCAAQSPPAPAVGVARTVPIPVRVTNITTGQMIHRDEMPTLGAPPPQQRGATIAFDTMTSHTSTARLNVAYVDPASYTGASPSTQAFAISLAERLAYRAPMDPENGLPLPTDIMWNDYACPPSHWPGGTAGPAQPIASFEFIPYFQNTETPVRARTHTVRIQFFSTDRLTDFGGFEAEFRVNPGQTGYAAAVINLQEMDPPVMAPRAGWVMIDWIEPNNSGVGCMFTGGDLQNPLYPRPESLWTTGTSSVSQWAFADGHTGMGGPPAVVDADFDGNGASTSYMDVLHTGALANWPFTAGTPATVFLPHDFAWRLTIGEGAPSCPCDVDGSGAINSQDFFTFMAGFFSGDADFNNSGETNTQDFFDFLICFFASC